MANIKLEQWKYCRIKNLSKLNCLLFPELSAEENEDLKSKF